jgi:hypothetical protein
MDRGIPLLGPLNWRAHNSPAELLLERTVAPTAADRTDCGKQRARTRIPQYAYSYG